MFFFFYLGNEKGELKNSGGEVLVSSIVKNLKVSKMSLLGVGCWCGWVSCLNLPVFILLKVLCLPEN